jgi:di/tripeptidase
MLTEEQQSELDKKNEYIEQKAKLLKEYKSYEVNLEYADDEWEEDLIMQKREKLAAKIKALGAKLREIETWEAKV